jgi:outer membrane protein
MSRYSYVRKLITLCIVGVICSSLGACITATGGTRPDYIGPRPVSQAGTVTDDTTSAAAVTRESETVRPPEGPLQVTVQGAILLALENNRALKVEKLNPAITRTTEDAERAVFDPLLAGRYSQYRERSEIPSRSTAESLANENSTELGISEYLPTGTDIEVSVSTERSWSDLYTDDLHSSRAGLSVTQALLRGAGLNYNLARLRQARLDTHISQFELRGFAESLVARVENTYWDYALIQRQIKIFLESLKLAEQQKTETEEIIRIGSLAESELAAAEAEIALRRENLINARSNLEKTRLTLLRLLNPPDADLWQRKIELLIEPKLPEVKLDDAESHVNVALRMRPDLNQARLQTLRGDLEIVRTKNGLLPRMDLFINLGTTGYAGSFGDSVRDADGTSYDILAGISFEYPVVNREARAKYERSILSREQAEEALQNLAQLVQVDVRSAYIEVHRTKEQIAATAATRALQEEKTRIETEKFRVGKSTTLLVAQAQRDLLQSRINEIQTIANYLKSLVALYQLEGSLLERRGIAAPGGGHPSEERWHQ